MLSEILTAYLTSSLLVVDKCVQCGRSDRGTALRPPVRDGRQAAVQEGIFRFCGAHETDWKPDHERRSNVEPEQLGERGRSVPDDPDGFLFDLLRSEPETRRRARNAESCGQLAGAWVGDEALRPVARDPGSHHPHVGNYRRASSQG